MVEVAPPSVDTIASETEMVDVATSMAPGSKVTVAVSVIPSPPIVPVIVMNSAVASEIVAV